MAVFLWAARLDSARLLVELLLSLDALAGQHRVELRPGVQDLLARVHQIHDGPDPRLAGRHRCPF